MGTPGSVIAGGGGGCLRTEGRVFADGGAGLGGRWFKNGRTYGLIQGATPPPPRVKSSTLRCTPPTLLQCKFFLSESVADVARRMLHARHHKLTAPPPFFRAQKTVRCPKRGSTGDFRPQATPGMRKDDHDTDAANVFGRPNNLLLPGIFLIALSLRLRLA